MRLRFSLLAGLSLVILWVQAQNQKEVYGSFEAGCKIYNYHFKQASNQINGFSITEIGTEFELLNLEKKRLDTTLLFFDSTIMRIQDSLKLTTLTDSSRVALKKLLSAFQSVDELATDVSSKVTDVKKLTEKKSELDSIIEQNRKLEYDTILKNFYGKSPSGFYSISDILASINELLLILKGREPGKYIYFNEFRQDVFENVFETYMKPYEPFSKTCATNIKQLASQVFGVIKGRIDFFDDEPTTAYLKLKGKRINIQIEKPGGTQKKLEKLKRKREARLAQRKSKAEVKAYRAETRRIMNAAKDRDSLLSMESLDISKSPASSININTAAAGITNKQNTKRNTGNVSRPKRGTDYLVFEVDNVQAEFEDGNLKNIYAELTFINEAGERGVTVHFRNNTPISVSNKFDPEKFENNKIYAGKSCEVYRIVKNVGPNSSGDEQLDKKINENTNCGELYFLLSDLLEYILVAENDKEDYSPANRVYHLNEQNPVQQLKKEKRSKVLVLKAYSDFVGIRDDQPNGLIQFEGSRRINLLTQRKQRTRSDYQGWLTYVEPRILFSKLERNNKFLYLDRKTLDTVKAVKENVKLMTLTPLQISQYSNFSILTDFNIYKYNWGKGKSNFQVNARFGYLRTAVSDSVRVIDSTATATPDLLTDNINSRTIGLGLLWEFKPDSRYGISFGYEIQHIKPYNDQYGITDGFNRLIQTFYFDGYLNTNNDDGKLFFRTKFNQLFNKWNKNFMQIQLGYSVNVFKAK